MRVLIIEDEVRLARMLRRVLEDEQYDVNQAHDGIEGEALARNGSYDLIVLDLMLPGRDGVTLCANLRRAAVKTPIMMLTAKDAIDDRVRGLDAGADDYLVKPFALAELTARLRALTRRVATDEPAALLSAGGLKMDLLQHEVQRDGRPIELTPREFSLLEYFLRHPGRALTRDQLLAGVWGYDASLTSNLVDIYVHYLRDKIDRGFDKKLIHTVRGVGYALRG